MPLMDEFQNRGSVSRSNQSTNQIWRVKLRLRQTGEFATIRFISPFAAGDVSKNVLADESHYVYHPGTSANGKRFTEYIYCADLNQDANGHIIEPSKCKCQLSGEYDTPPCYVNGKPSRNNNGTPDGFNSDAKQRYLYWVLHYYTFHLKQNPVIDSESDDYNAPWAVSRREAGEVDAWEEVEIGNRTFYRESVMKPQILEMARATRESLRTYATMYGDITGRNFDYHRQQDQSGRSFINYQILPSEQEVPKLGKERVGAVISDLPRLDRIASGQIEGVDIESFAMEDKEADKEALSRMSESVSQLADEEPVAEVAEEEPKKEAVMVPDDTTEEDPFATMGNTEDF